MRRQSVGPDSGYGRAGRRRRALHARLLPLSAERSLPRFARHGPHALRGRGLRQRDPPQRRRHAGRHRPPSRRSGLRVPLRREMACPRGQSPRFGHGIPPHLEDGRPGAGRRLRRGAEGVRRLEAALFGRFAAQSPRNLRIRTQRNAAIRRAGALLHRRVPQSPGQFHALDLCGRSADARTRLLAPLPRHLHLHAGRLATLSLRLLPPRGARRS